MPPLSDPDDDQQLLAATAHAIDAPDRRHAPRSRARDRLLAGRTTCWSIPGPSSCLPTLLEALGERAAAGAAADPHPPRPRRARAARWSSAGRTSRSTCTSAARRTWSTRRGCSRARAGCTATTWTGCGARWSRCPSATSGCCTAASALFDGAFEVAYTPGHASHHVSYLHDGTAFVGDVGGVRITPGSLTIPPTPPPDIDVEAWHESIERIRGVGAASGWRSRTSAPIEDVDAQLGELSRAARRLGRARPRAGSGRVHRRRSRPRSRPRASPGRRRRTPRRRRPSSSTRGSSGTGESAPRPCPRADGAAGILSADGADGRAAPGGRTRAPGRAGRGG